MQEYLSAASTAAKPSVKTAKKHQTAKVLQASAGTEQKAEPLLVGPTFVHGYDNSKLRATSRCITP